MATKDTLAPAQDAARNRELARSVNASATEAEDTARRATQARIAVVRVADDSAAADARVEKAFFETAATAAKEGLSHEELNAYSRALSEFAAVQATAAEARRAAMKADRAGGRAGRDAAAASQAAIEADFVATYGAPPSYIEVTESALKVTPTPSRRSGSWFRR